MGKIHFLAILPQKAHKIAKQCLVVSLVTICDVACDGVIADN